MLTQNSFIFILGTSIKISQLLATFEDEEFSEAKDALRKHVELEKGDCNGLLGEQPKRRNSKVRTSTQADCEDVLNALSTLKRSGDLPRLAISVGELLVLPPILPQLILSKRRASALEGAEEHSFNCSVQRNTCGSRKRA
eukprot:GHVO01011235.1.p1 GENE.GHVO01011235.1~~GHVO01011235.1.p1  ORF type:complete len:140 (+),score=6.07 GHVO01011235.1:1108-1527(+)